MEENSEYVGLDVHKDTIAVAVASPGRGEAKSLGIITNTKKSVLKLIGKLSPQGKFLNFAMKRVRVGTSCTVGSIRPATRVT